MLIYQNTTAQFIRDIKLNKLTDIMSDTFLERFGHRPSPPELISWQNSLPRVSHLIELAGLTDNMIALEYEVPYNTERIDCLLFGKDSSSTSNIVLLELKQWSKVTALEDEGNFEEITNVNTFTGGGNRVVAHPSQQVRGYHNHLHNFVSAFEEAPPLLLFSCAYCHNYTRNEDSGLFDPVYKPLLENFPVYTATDTEVLADKIKGLLDAGNGTEIFNRFMRSTIRPSKKLLDNLTQIIKNEEVFSLLNEQLTAKNLIWSKVKKAEKNKEKSVIIVHGGPGTGKSVIAINLLAEAAKRRKKVLYGCKSTPFTEGLKNLMEKGLKVEDNKSAKALFQTLSAFLPSKVSENDFDLILIDEAHRIGKTSNAQFTPKQHRSDMPQIDQLIRCAKTSVFFIDDKQGVRSQEIGSSELIRQAAAKLNCKVYETSLLTQFRCMGSNNYLLWLESVLGYNDSEMILSKNEIFDFQIMDSPQELYAVIKAKEAEKENSARLVAGFCWPWSKTLDDNGELIKDVKIGDFALPWESHMMLPKIPKGYVKWFEWAYKPDGIKQVGCIYTAQGFEFEYIGVIIGNDLVFDSETNSLKTNIKASADPKLTGFPQNFDSYVRNIYRTLLSRGMKGCYVYFTNKETEKYFRARIENNK